MRLQVIREVSRTEKAVNLEFLHPRTLRHHFAWMPISQIEYLPMNEIRITDWLWDNMKNST